MSSFGILFVSFINGFCPWNDANSRVMKISSGLLNQESNSLLERDFSYIEDGVVILTGRESSS